MLPGGRVAREPVRERGDGGRGWVVLDAWPLARLADRADQAPVGSDGPRRDRGAPDPPLDPPGPLDLAWRAARADAPALPAETPRLIELLAEAAHLADRELAPAHRLDGWRERGVLRVEIEGRGPMVIGFANGGFQAGAFSRQVGAVRAAGRGAEPVVARLSPFPSGRKSVEAMRDLRRNGGRGVVLAPAHLQAVLVAGALGRSVDPDRFRAWLSARRPISSLSSIRSLFDLDGRPSAPGPTA